MARTVSSGPPQASARHASHGTSPWPSRDALHGASIDRYYDQTWLDYRFVWLSGRNLAFHFGHYGEDVRTHAQALANANRVLAERAGIRRDERVLDAGCGVGGSAFWLAHECDAAVIGVTRVASQVAQAQSLAAGQTPRHRPIFLQADYTAPPFRTGTFDVVWALESLCHAPDKAAFYREAARVLRPGGRLVLAEYMLTGEPRDGTARRMVSQWLDGWAMPNLATPSQHREFARAAGFETLHFEDATPTVERSLRRLYRIATLTYPLALTARGLRLRSAVQHGNVIAAIRQYQALRRGYWVYGIFCAVR
jgi:cyclopropane fatty-acyl-phospholipid synthase-like methyltransferase